MTVVAEAYNKAGAVIWSTQTFPFVFVGKGSFDATDHWTGAPNAIGSNPIGTFGSTTVGYDFDLVAFRCTDAFFLPANRPYDDDPPRTIRVTTQDCWPPSVPGIYRYPADYKTGLSSHQIDFWCFRSIGSFEPTSGVGLWVFNKDVLCFDSGLPMAEVVHQKYTYADAGTSAPGTAEALPDPDNTALMKFGTTALAAVSGVSPNYRTVWYNEAVKNTSAGYSRKHFSAFFRHKSEITGTSPGASIGGGGLIGIDISRF